MQAKIDLSSVDIQVAIKQYIQEKFGFEEGDYELIIEVKSKQNYKSEWEQAEYRGKFSVTR
jgi:hypothetical protein